jgi:predicted permease
MGINGNNRVIWFALFFNTIQCNYYNTVAIIFGALLFLLYFFIFGKKITIKGYRSKKLIHKM